MFQFIRPHILLYFFLIALAAAGFLFTTLWPQTVGFYLFIVFAALGGLGVTIYIDHTKRNKEQLMCPTGSNCNVVVNSKYATFLGVHLEHWGMLYYSVIVVSYLAFILFPEVVGGVLSIGVWLATAFAFLFSLYLLFVQAVLLRQWCIWCLLSASLSILIFIISLTGVGFAAPFLLQAVGAMVVVRDIGFVLGVGAATAALFLFHRFLRDLDINRDELGTFQGISEVVWVGLGLVLAGQFSLYVTFPAVLAASGTFLVQTAALLVAALAGAVLMVLFAPFLTVMSFGESSSNSSLASLRRPLFATGAIALGSWYFAFAMNYTAGYGAGDLFAAYGVWLACAIAAALLWERSLRQRVVDRT